MTKLDKRTLKTKGSYAAMFKAGTALFLLFALPALLISCAEVKVRKVPTPTQYDAWTDDMQKSADSLEGFRFYLPRPFINVFESFPIHADVYMTDGVVSPDSKYVLLQIAPDSYLGTILGKVGMTAKIASRLITPANVKMAEALAEGMRPQAGEAEPPPEEEPEKPSEPVSVEKTGIGIIDVTNDNSAFAYQPLRGNMDIVYLPDFEEQYVVSSKSRLGNVQFGLNLGQGWSLQGFNSLTDNSAINDRIFSLIDEAQKLAFQVAPSLLGLPPLPPGTADILKPQAGQALPDRAKDAVPGTPVSVKITIVHYAAKGLYPLIKPREIDADMRQIDIRTGTSILPGETTNPIRELDERHARSHTYIPVYPYQYISFNTFQYLAFEVIKPDTAPFNYLYDKTGTAGDPGDSRTGDVGQNVISGPTPSETTVNSDTQGTNELIRNTVERLAEILNSAEFGEVTTESGEPGQAKFRIVSADVEGGDRVKVKVEKTSGDPSTELTPEILAETIILRAKTLDEQPFQKEMIVIDNFAEAAGIRAQSGEVAPPSLAAKVVKTDPVAKQLSRWEVRVIQAALCLPPGQIDGVWGKQTAGALQQFQKERRISPADGRLTEEQRQLLVGMNGSDVAERCRPGSAEPNSVAGQLTREQITAIQLSLCLTGKQIDGTWSPTTIDALKRYQTRVDAVPVDGNLTEAQRDKLLTFKGQEIAIACGG